MKKKIRINVTQRDIDKGRPNTSKYCPIALAAKRLFPSDNTISVGVFGIYIWKANRRIATYRLSGGAKDFIIAIDKHTTPKPKSAKFTATLIERY